MRNIKVTISAFSAALLLAACGDEVTQINQTGLEVYSAEKDLPKCSDKNEGEQAFVKGESFARVCDGEDWVALDGSSSDFACKTEELKDKSGLKIVCNGDSIGVVLNGSDGKDGKAGKDGSDGEDGKAGTGCSMTDRTDSTITVVCGDSTMVIELGVGASADTAEADSERVPISLDSIVGLTQKGPFLKGSTVYLYELSDGRTLKQTNGNFTSNISQENGRYKFLARDLVSQYAMIIVDGYYRNEVTGGPSNAPIRLKAITDMRKHSSVNVNILTHLEFERVYYLVTKEKYTVKQAKRKAQREILNFFGINLDGNADAEDMDVFGSSDADAALLAISILLQGNRSESDMMALLSEMSSAMAKDSVWDNDRAKAIKAELADWAFSQRLPKLRKNVEGWHLGNGNVGNFEKYINNFIATTFGIDTCGSQVSTVKMKVKNQKSIFHGRSYECYAPAEEFVQGWDRDNKHPEWVEVRPPNPYLNPDYEYQYYMIDWRDRKRYSIIDLEAEFDYKVDFFDVDENDNIVHRDSTVYNMTYMVWLAENLDFDYRVDGKPYGTDCFRGDCFSDSSKAFGRYYTWAAAMDSAGVYSNQGVGCGYWDVCNTATRVRGICPEGWHLPSKAELEILLGYLKYAYEGRKLAEILRAKGPWRNTDGYNTDDLGLSIVPAGDRVDNSTSVFYWYGSAAFLWTSDKKEETTDMSYILKIDDYNSEEDVKIDAGGNTMHFSVRCLQNFW